MTTVKELREFLRRLGPADLIGIDDSGLSLVVVDGEQASDEALELAWYQGAGKASFEIGGFPERERAQ